MVANPSKKVQEFLLQRAEEGTADDRPGSNLGLKIIDKTTDGDTEERMKAELVQILSQECGADSG